MSACEHHQHAECTVMSVTTVCTTQRRCPATQEGTLSDFLPRPATTAVVAARAGGDSPRRPTARRGLGTAAYAGFGAFAANCSRLTAARHSETRERISAPFGQKEVL